MKNSGAMKLVTVSDREIVITRDFDAPRHLVFEAFTKPELLKRWLFGPPGWTMVVCEMDVRVGGAYRWVWRGPDGVEMGMGGIHREIVPPERIVSTQLFDQDWTGGEVLGTMVLTEQDGKTTLTNTLLYSSRESRDAVLKTPMEHGMAMGYDRIANLLAGTRNVGDFCWINMLTPRPAEAREFFGKLLGWTYAEIPGLGHRIQVGGRDIGGLFDLDGPNTPKGLPPLIGVMIKVDSVDATCERIKSLGGSVKTTMDIMNNLRMAVCFDPSGANFDLFEPKAQQGTNADSMLHGAPSWFELMTTDVDGGAKFYSQLFGWTPEVMPMGARTYTTLQLGPTFVAGMMQISPEIGNVPPHWGTYFTVTDVDQTAREAVALGAKLCLALKDVPGVGRFCGLTSPQGVSFCVIQYIR